MGPLNKDAHGGGRLHHRKELGHTSDQVATVLPQGDQTAGCRGHMLAKPPMTCLILSESVSKARVGLKLNQLSGWSWESLICDDALPPKLGHKNLDL